MSTERLHLLILGAHPDDADFSAGGLAALYAAHGHIVKMVSLTNGDAGHFAEGGAPLAWRRRAEAATSGKVLGAEYITLDTHDGELLPTLEVRRELIALIRQFAPDLLLGPRPYDYHPDHRYTAQLIQDAAYMLTVPNAVSHIPHLRRMPVIAYVWDHFQKPNPFTPDVVISIDEVADKKMEAMHCHTSQVYEWLPYNREEDEPLPEDEAARRKWLRRWLEPRLRHQADLYRERLIARYGEERGRAVKYAEAFEICEYGAPPSEEKLKRLFPF